MVINLKNPVIVRDKIRVNRLKMRKNNDGSIQVWLNNGDNYSTFRIDAEQQKIITDFFKNSVDIDSKSV